MVGITRPLFDSSIIMNSSFSAGDGNGSSPPSYVSSSFVDIGNNNLKNQASQSKAEENARLELEIMAEIKEEQAMAAMAYNTYHTIYQRRIADNEDQNSTVELVMSISDDTREDGKVVTKEHPVWFWLFAAFAILLVSGISVWVCFKAPSRVQSSTAVSNNVSTSDQYSSEVGGSDGSSEVEELYGGLSPNAKTIRHDAFNMLRKVDRTMVNGTSSTTNGSAVGVGGRDVPNDDAEGVDDSSNPDELLVVRDDESSSQSSDNESNSADEGIPQGSKDSESSSIGNSRNSSSVESFVGDVYQGLSDASSDDDVPTSNISMERTSSSTTNSSTRAEGFDDSSSSNVGGATAASSQPGGAEIERDVSALEKNDSGSNNETESAEDNNGPTFSKSSLIKDSQVDTSSMANSIWGLAGEGDQRSSDLERRGVDDAVVIDSTGVDRVTSQLDVLQERDSGSISAEAGASLPSSSDNGRLRLEDVADGGVLTLNVGKTNTGSALTGNTPPAVEEHNNEENVRKKNGRREIFSLSEKQQK